MIRWILGSNSPRRKELLSALGLEFVVFPKDTDESFSSNLPKNEVAEYLACKKAEAYSNELKLNDVVICADTTVLFQNQLLEKPQNKEEAIEMLSKLSGNVHEVITGVCLMSKNKKISFSETTKVFFSPLNSNEIEFYIDNFKPFDKAGSYGIQEWIGMVAVSKIEGTFSNVMGLPTCRLYQEIQKHFTEV